MTVRQKSARRKSPHSRRKSRNMRKSTSTRGKTARKSKSLRHGYHRMLRGGGGDRTQTLFGQKSIFDLATTDVPLNFDHFDSSSPPLLSFDAVGSINQNQNAVTKLTSILDGIINGERDKKITNQFDAITTFFGNTLNERKQGKIKTILRSDEDNTTKATSILQAIADDKKSRDSMYALLGLGGAAAAYMLGRKHGGKTEKRRQSSQNRQG